MAGDHGGWFESLWVPFAGVVMVMAIWVWDRVLVLSSLPDWNWDRYLSLALLPNNRHPKPILVSSLGMVRSSLHQPPLSPDYGSEPGNDGEGVLVDVLE